MPSLRYDGFQSAMPPVAQMSRPAARSRGPGKSPSLMARLSATSTACTEPAERAAV